MRASPVHAAVPTLTLNPAFTPSTAQTVLEIAATSAFALSASSKARASGSTPSSR